MAAFWKFPPIKYLSDKSYNQVLQIKVDNIFSLIIILQQC